MNGLIKTIKKHPILSLFLIAMVLYQSYSVWQSKGPVIVIEANEPAEDFVVVCKWYNESLLFGGHSTGSYQSGHKVFVAKSGEKINCGFSLWGEDPTYTIKHPTLAGDGSQNYIKNGVRHIVFNKTKIDLLDEQKAKFEAGYWDKDRNPGSRYAGTLGGCGFDYQYFDYYSQSKKVDKEHFKKRYNDFFLECKKRVIPIKNKYLSHTYKGARPSPEESMKILWNSKGWGKYK